MQEKISQNCLISDKKLFQGQFLVSLSRNYFATIQPDANLVVYVSSHLCSANIIYSSNTKSKGMPPYYLICQNDGNLVIYDSKETPLWATNTWGKGNKPYSLIIQDDGNLVMSDSVGVIIWSAGCSR